KPCRWRRTARRVSGWVTPVRSSAEAHVSLGLTATSLPRTRPSSGMEPRASSIASAMSAWCVMATSGIRLALGVPGSGDLLGRRLLVVRRFDLAGGQVDVHGAAVLAGLVALGVGGD